MRRVWAAGVGAGTLALALGCGSVLQPERFEHDGCRCSVEVPFLWLEQDLVDEETVELGSVAEDRYVFAEFLGPDDVAEGVDLATLADHFVGDDIPFDPLEPPESRTVDGRRAALRWLGPGAMVDGVPLQGVLATAAYRDGYVRLFAWSLAGDKADSAGAVGRRRLPAADGDRGRAGAAAVLPRPAPGGARCRRTRIWVRRSR